MASENFLTVGMTTHNDYDGVFFTVQSLRLHHPETPFDLIVVDQNPDSPYGKLTKAFVERFGTYIPQPGATGGPPQGRNAYFQAAKTPVVLSVDCHVLFQQGSLAKVVEYFSLNPDSKDLLHGPLLYDDLNSYSTHWEPKWMPNNFGHWATDARGKDPKGTPFEIPFSGVGVMACRKAAWPGYSPDFLGFGAEEWYIHRKFRRRGGTVLCHPGVRWVHRFGRMPHSSYSALLWQTIYNHLLGSIELHDHADVEVQLKHWMQYPRELDDALRTLAAKGYIKFADERKP